MLEAAVLHRARERRASGRTLIEGPNLLDEALQAGIRPEVVFCLPDDDLTLQQARASELDLLIVQPAAMARLGGSQSPRGPVAVIAIPPPANASLSGLLVAWGVSDPGNVGTMIRTAAAFGWGFGYTPGTADPWSPKVLRAGAAAHFTTPVHSLDSVADLVGLGLESVAAVAREGSPPGDLGPGRYAVLIGEEAAGLPAEVVRHADHRVTIGMPGGTESLNAAIAAAIIVYELAGR